MEQRGTTDCADNTDSMIAEEHAVAQFRRANVPRVLFSAVGRKASMLQNRTSCEKSTEFARLRQPFGHRPTRCTPAACAPQSMIRVIRSSPNSDLTLQRFNAAKPFVSVRGCPKKQKRREDFSSRRWVSPWGWVRLLLHTDRKHDAWAKSQVNAERIGIARGQIAGVHIKVPLSTSKGEGNVRNSGLARFVHLLNRAPYLTRHGQLAALGIIEKHRIRV